MPILNLDYSYVPTDYCVKGLKNYFEQHRKPGDFLTALLENDFQRIIAFADPVNRSKLIEWAGWLRSEPGMHSFGSKEKVSKWLAMQLPLGEASGTDNDDDRRTVIHEQDSDSVGDSDVQEARR